MQIEIWSDYACPYCYIGKRNLEKALEKFEHNVSNKEIEDLTKWIKNKF